MSTGNKSPYEIRLNTLELAYQIVNNRKQAEYVKKQLEANNNDYQAVVCCPGAVDISADEVIEEARKLNNFISSSDRK